MITYVRTSIAQPGKAFEYMAAQQESLSHATRASGVKWTLATGVGGVVGQFSLWANVDSLADIEAALAKLMADADWRAATAKTQSLTVPGSSHDQIWRHL
jgi:hypothetical protein